MDDEKRKALIEARRRRAIACADRVVRLGRMCAGCEGDAYCGISRKFDEAYPGNVINQLLNDPVFLRNVTIIRLGPLGERSDDA